MKKDVIINMTDQMEATPIAHLVALANQFKSQIYLEMGRTRVNAKSIMGMMSLVLMTGATVTVDANGEDEEEAVAALKDFLTT
ncbi:MAG: HPr family phosphocarrier protein [Lachnospiraceae bacterium]|nr:HPr family phosphocarrier protein [Lachnospiraceae bacterium]